MSFDKKKWRAELLRALEIDTGHDPEGNILLALLERAYAEGQRFATEALEEIHIKAAASGSTEFLAEQRRHIGQLAIDTLAAARGTP